MKKISVVSILAMIVMPVLAEEINPVVEPINADVVAVESGMGGAEVIAPQEIPEIIPVQQYKHKTSNPKTKFPRGLQLGIGVSPTSGLNGFIGYNNKNFDSFWAKRFGIRFDFANYSPIKNRLNTKINNAIGDEGIKINDDLHIDNVELNAKHFGAIIDFYPFGNTWFLGGWRLSGGYMTGKLDLDASIVGKTVDGNIEFDLNGHKYYYVDDTRGMATLDWKYSGPYLGTGFDLGLFWGFKIYMDAGVVFSDASAKIALDIPTEGLYTGGNEVVADENLLTQFYIDKTAEVNDAQKELDKYPYYPLVKIGFMYRF